MVPQSYLDFFMGSASASAALLGLLFVSISLAPDTTVGKSATAERRGRSVSAFVALLNAFFVSLLALIPGTNLGYGALIWGVIAIANTLSDGPLYVFQRHSEPTKRRIVVTFGSTITYGLELWFAILLIQHQNNRDAFNGLVYVLLAFYGIGVMRAWSLLGAERSSALTLLGQHHKTRETVERGNAANDAVGKQGE